MLARLLRVDGVSGVEGFQLEEVGGRCELTRPRKERWVSALVMGLFMETGSLVPNSVGLRTRRLLLGVGFRRALASKMEDELARWQRDPALVTGSSVQQYGHAVVCALAFYWVQEIVWIGD